MMQRARSTRKDRIIAAAAALLVQGLLVLALITGLAVSMPGPAPRPLALFRIAPPPAPPPRKKTIRHPTPSHKREGAAAPPNLRARATPVVAPPPLVPPPVPPPVIAASQPGLGNQPSAGAAPVRGPGTGAGGRGEGTGSGNAGDGDGDGGDEIPPRWVKGRIRDSDYPRAAKDALIGGTVSVRYTVAVTGRVRACTVTRSSGNADLDATTCRLIIARFRFRPSRDADGTPVESIIVENHSWEVDGQDAPAAIPPP